MKRTELSKIIITFVLLLFSSCVSKKVCENCKIESILYLEAKRHNSYIMQVRFSHCLSNEKRKELVKSEISNKCSISQSQIVCIDEFMGKKYNEYRYVIIIRD